MFSLVRELGQAPSSSIDLSVFAQYGVLGAVFVISLVVLRSLYLRREKDRDAYEAEQRETIKRLQDELSRTQDTIRENYMDALTEAQKAVTEALRRVPPRAGR